MTENSSAKQAGNRSFDRIDAMLLAPKELPLLVMASVPLFQPASCT